MLTMSGSSSNAMFTVKVHEHRMKNVPVSPWMHGMRWRISNQHWLTTHLMITINTTIKTTSACDGDARSVGGGRGQPASSRRWAVQVRLFTLHTGAGGRGYGYQCGLDWGVLVWLIDRPLPFWTESKTKVLDGSKRQYTYSETDTGTRAATR